MKKILFLITILMPMAAWAQLFNADITVNGSKKTAEFMVSGQGECKLGNGRNACISQYTKSRRLIDLHSACVLRLPVSTFPKVLPVWASSPLWAVVLWRR